MLQYLDWVGVVDEESFRHLPQSLPLRQLREHQSVQLRQSRLCLLQQLLRLLVGGQSEGDIVIHGADLS